ncbi:calcium-binding protein [Paracoccus sp. 1_MG-2023]|uniref:calcium-binding protein n=1 Tax=unclassified Paracoccus (in: a-proteobacteria) TaxID=2688777 RepID=UPI001C0904D8|nr:MULTISPECIES: calcium-binding protein [unclassified Paracoccus (in: a-proteobacteria)]MBU2957449.1 hypothetical protein [Paracoccus sp. C2R09]MDO6669647.1 calcium-binding protein [Paracoccus sp. 1_MG-2023]
MPDTGSSRLISFDAPTILDLRNGAVDATFAASIDDPDGIEWVVIWYDRPLATDTGAYALEIISGYGSDWDDGSHSNTVEVLPHNVGGDLNITRVVIEDKLGNETTFSDDALRDMGIDTSISIRSVDPDTTAPELTSLVLPDSVDLSAGSTEAEFTASGADANALDDVVIFFDRELTWRYSPTLESDHAVEIISQADWTGEALTEVSELSASNYSGAVDVRKVQITDVYGNSREYSNEQLRELGFDTSLELIGTSAPGLDTYVAELPETITLREGQSVDLGLNFVGMTNHYVSYEYSVSAAGGTASASDIGQVSGSGSLSIYSTRPSSRSETVTISANRDGIAEATETAYLTVSLSGNMTFADGGTIQVVQINIQDDNLTVGGNGRDTLYGTSAADTFEGGLGNDRYYVTSGDRIVEGAGAGAGTDTVYANIGYALDANVENLDLIGSGRIDGAGNGLANRIGGNDAANKLSGFAGHDTLSGAGGDDTLNGNYGNDTLSGGDGVDLLNGGVGDDLLWGGNGNDRLFGQAGNDRLNGQAGNDLLGGAGGDDTLNGNDGNDTLAGGDGADLLNGGGGDDLLWAGNGNDRLFGQAGDDRLNGQAGNDLLGGAGGDDTLNGNGGNDTLAGGDGADLLNGGGGDDLLWGGNGDDRLFGQAGADRLNGQAGDDLLGGAGGDDTLNGNNGNDTLAGANGADKLYGGGHDDVLWGGNGSDVLHGQAGNDRLIGGNGVDVLTGGNGADHFVFTSITESGVNARFRDTVTDFRPGQSDRIDLRGIDADAGSNGNQAFDFIGDDRFSGEAGQIRFHHADGNTIVMGDVDGDARGDFSIALLGQFALSENDFFL